MEAAVGWGDTAPVFLLLLVIVVDALIGAFPGFRVILDAPLTAVRAITRWFDGKLNREHRGGEARRMRGLIAVLIIAALAWFVGLLVSGAARAVPQGWIIEMAGLLMVLRYGDCISRMQKGWRLLAGKNNQETRLTAGPLIRPLIRYDAQNLDHFGLARAAIEGGMARFCDRFLATVFWYLLLGLPGLFVCRAVNAVADVIGNRSPRHISFGFVAARFDDVMNLVPAIVAGPVIGLAAIFVPNSSATGAFRGWISDLRGRVARSDYRGEGAMAGALGVALGGPRPFGKDIVTGGWIGDGRARITATDVQRSVYLIAVACLLTTLALALTILA